VPTTMSSSSPVPLTAAFVSKRACRSCQPSLAQRTRCDSAQASTETRRTAHRCRCLQSRKRSASISDLSVPGIGAAWESTSDCARPPIHDRRLAPRRRQTPSHETIRPTLRLLPRSHRCRSLTTTSEIDALVLDPCEADSTSLCGSCVFLRRKGACRAVDSDAARWRGR
jgi:hypothetical protein